MELILFIDSVTCQAQLMAMNHSLVCTSDSQAIPPLSHVKINVFSTCSCHYWCSFMLYNYVIIPYIVDTPSPQSTRSALTQYDINPNVGPIPDAPPPTTSYPHPSDECVDPEHGQCPGTPPPSSSLFTLNDSSLAPTTPPHHSTTAGTPTHSPPHTLSTGNCHLLLMHMCWQPYVAS